MTDSVGDVFDDRAPSGESRTSIVRVASYPPITHGSRNGVRFGSLMPESSARPLKRSMEVLPSDSMSQHYPLFPSIEDWDSQQSSITLGRTSKRQKIEAPRRLDDADDSDPGNPRVVAETPRAQGSVQVLSSQQTPRQKCKSIYAPVCYNTNPMP